MKTVRVRNGVIRKRNKTVNGGMLRVGGALREVKSFKKIDDENVNSLKDSLSKLSLRGGKNYIKL